MLSASLSLVIPEIGRISDWETKIYIALIFGSIISATDPVAVVALLKEIGKIIMAATNFYDSIYSSS